MVKISVIIPTLNEEKHIEECLLSFKKQDFKDYEIIVADGLSSDNTVKIAKKYTSKVISSMDKSIGAGRNKGAKIAKGELLLFTDADTVVAPNLLKKLNEALEGGDIIGATVEMKAKEKPTIFEHVGLILYNFLVRISLIFQFLTPQVAGVCLCVRKKIFDDVGGFNEEMKTNEDLDFCERAKKYGKFVYVNSTYVKTSLRRMRRWGHAKFFTYHLISWINYMLFKKGRTKYTVVR
ncbi:MAG: glycosyltransferase [Candidatus Parvarchaeota archaeon]|nr:glycosyltransferase [Candidatus Jingweiarchaeum tengchongense]MCW1300091.1 glycosyltransferase [Candidatus Jingweiarchaeum tengchongense]MCW1304445.1 glycosyltransferase [Candidatus Jingweiarchaeum tengchongense]MCW1305612.1 glycosyltransferase [Candidatus Jingweiarchaeum tengchongense]MCW1309267.1 glycosyltransferase [Candidatus Jingweiarchaeum tengchongense]